MMPTIRSSILVASQTTNTGSDWQTPRDTWKNKNTCDGSLSGHSSKVSTRHKVEAFKRSSSSAAARISGSRIVWNVGMTAVILENSLTNVTKKVANAANMIHSAPVLTL
jgi:hypothetical protein